MAIAMKHLCGVLVLGSTVVAHCQGVIAPLTFDDVSPGDFVSIQDGYHGMQWNNFYIQNGLTSPGFYKGAVSPPNVALNGFGDPASISSLTPFTLQSAYLTAVYVGVQQIRAQGFAGGALMYDNTYTVNSTAPTLVTFGYAGIDQVRFSITTSPTGSFAMDNLVIVPEPSAGALFLAAGTLWLFVFRRRKAREI